MEEKNNRPEVQRKERYDQTEVIFEVTVGENFLKPDKDIKLSTQESLQIPGRITEKEIHTEALNNKMLKPQNGKKIKS